MPVHTPSYTAPVGLNGGHRQTLFASLIRRVDFAYDRRERITTPDDDFLDLAYEPAATDLICEFTIEPAADMSMEAAASRVAALIDGVYLRQSLGEAEPNGARALEQIMGYVQLELGEVK